jgi:hypothetical protein
MVCGFIPPMREVFVMAFSELATVWYMLQYVLGLSQWIGYAFGFLLASWAFDMHFQDGSLPKND